jgi:hypothetical protein
VAELYSFESRSRSLQSTGSQYRFLLQTLVEIGSEKNTTLVFPVPLDMFSNLGRVLEHLAAPSRPA